MKINDLSKISIPNVTNISCVAKLSRVRDELNVYVVGSEY